MLLISACVMHLNCSNVMEFKQSFPTAARQVASTASKSPRGPAATSFTNCTKTSGSCEYNEERALRPAGPVRVLQFVGLALTCSALIHFMGIRLVYPRLNVPVPCRCVRVGNAILVVICVSSASGFLWSSHALCHVYSCLCFVPRILQRWTISFRRACAGSTMWIHGSSLASTETHSSFRKKTNFV